MNEAQTLADANGMVGRYCARDACGGWYKVHPEPGVDPSDVACPYCGLSEKGPGLVVRFLETLLETMRPEYETPIVCDRCSLEFAVTRPFESCPYCRRQNAYRVFNAGLDVCARRLRLLDLGVAENLHAALIDDVVRGAGSAFDALGRKLHAMHPAIPAPHAGIEALDAALSAADGSIAVRVGAAERQELARLLGSGHGETRAEAHALLTTLTRLGASLERDFRDAGTPPARAVTRRKPVRKSTAP